MDEFNNDLFEFIRKLRLRYHFRNSKLVDPSIVKLPSTYTPPPNEDAELERIIQNIKKMRVIKVRSPDQNMTPALKTALENLVHRITEGEIVVKSADKGDITVLMSQDFYYRMCLNELSKEKFYRPLGRTDPSRVVLNDVKNFANRYRDILTRKEYQFLTSNDYKMANFYMLPKLHKSASINNMLKEGSEYVHLPDFEESIEGRPIVGGPTFYTSGISQMLNYILKPITSHIPHILKDSFDFVERCNHSVPDGTLLGTADIKALYTNLSKELVFTAVEYWVSRYSALIPILQRFGLQFILDGLEIILEHNYFLFDSSFYQQIHGFAMGTKAAVDCANLSVAFLEVKAFEQLPRWYPHDFVRHFIDSYFRFLDDVKYEWLEDFDVTPFQSLWNEMDPHLQFIFSELLKQQNYLDINAKVIGYELSLDIYRKPTDSFNYLAYTSCHPSHTKDNIALSLAKRIIRISTEDPHTRLDELKHNLMLRGHPEQKIIQAFSKVYSPQRRDKSGDNIVFSHTHNPSQSFVRKQITDSLKEVKSDSMKKTFGNCRVIVGTRQPKSLRQHLIRSKFSRTKKKIVRKIPGLYACRSCKYHRLGYIRPCKIFHFGKDNVFHWEYRRHFTCNAKNVIYILKCKHCWRFYIGETNDLKPRTRKHKSDVKHPKNSNCRVLAEHLRSCHPVGPSFNIFPIMYVDDRSKRKFIEKRLIMYFQPPLNVDG